MYFMMIVFLIALPIFLHLKFPLDMRCLILLFLINLYASIQNYPLIYIKIIIISNL